MTIDEAIIHCEEVAIRNLKNENNAKCVQCGEEHVQLAKWLKELKAYKSMEDLVPVVRCKECRNSEYDFVTQIRGCSWFRIPVTDDFFCAKGERKE